MQHERPLTLPSLTEIANASYLALNICKDTPCLTPHCSKSHTFVVLHQSTFFILSTRIHNNLLSSAERAWFPV